MLTRRAERTEAALVGFRCDKPLAQEVNTFYLKFAASNFRNIIRELKPILSDSGPSPFLPLVNMLNHSRARQSPRPDNTGSCLIISVQSN